MSWQDILKKKSEKVKQQQKWRMDNLGFKEDESIFEYEKRTGDKITYHNKYDKDGKFTEAHPTSDNIQSKKHGNISSTRDTYGFQTFEYVIEGDAAWLLIRSRYFNIPQLDRRKENEKEFLDPELDGMAKKQGVSHYTKDGKEWFGETHKMPDGKLMTQNPHNEKSVRLYHANELIATKNSTGQDEEAAKRTEENESELLAQFRARNKKTRGELNE